MKTRNDFAQTSLAKLAVSGRLFPPHDDVYISLIEVEKFKPPFPETFVLLMAISQVPNKIQQCVPHFSSQGFLSRREVSRGFLMVFKKVTLRYKSSLKTWQLTQWPLSTISQALFLIWMNILETYDGHNISHVMKGDEYYPFIHEFRHFFTFQVCH